MRHGADVRDPLVKCRTRRVRVAHRKLRLQLTRQPWFCLPNFNSKGHLPVSICLFRRPPPHPVRIADLNTTPSKSFSITRCFFFFLAFYLPLSSISLTVALPGAVCLFVIAWRRLLPLVDQPSFHCASITHRLSFLQPLPLVLGWDHLATCAPGVAIVQRRSASCIPEQPATDRAPW